MLMPIPQPRAMTSNGSERLRATNDGTAETVWTVRLDRETERNGIEEMKVEAREAVMVRRRLHNLVQELKGNVRVLVLVWPMLPLDVSSSNDEKARIAALANISYPESGFERSARDCA